MFVLAVLLLSLVLIMVVGIYRCTFDFDTFKSVIFRYSRKWLLGSFWHLLTSEKILIFTPSKMTLLKVSELMPTTILSYILWKFSRRIFHNKNHFTFWTQTKLWYKIELYFWRKSFEKAIKWRLVKISPPTLIFSSSVHTIWNKCVLWTPICEKVSVTKKTKAAWFYKYWIVKWLLSKVLSLFEIFGPWECWAFNPVKNTPVFS